MAEQEHPCANGLTPECFEAYPEWAKLAFAYKLLNVLIPANISRRLPKGLFPGIIGPGAVLPPGWIPPPGVIVPPNYTVPPSWIPFTYFILDPGLTWEEAFPPGWTAGDPLPDGVSLEPGSTLPPGWTPENPPPNWFAPGGAGLPIPPGGVLPPLYLPPGLQSPPHVPQPRSPISAKATCFYVKVTRGDGTVIDDSAELDGYFDVYNSSEGWIPSTIFAYNPTTQYWKVEIDPEDIDENGYFVFIDYNDGIETQYPFRYKRADQWNAADLTQFGTYEAEVPYWVITSQAETPPKDFGYPYDPANQFGWADVYGFPAGWGYATITLAFIRGGFYHLIDETIGNIVFNRIVKSSIPYYVIYRCEARTTFPIGTRWTFYVYDAATFLGFDNAFSYTLSGGGLTKTITPGVGFYQSTNYEADIAGKTHEMTLEPIDRVGGSRFLALRLGNGCSVSPYYE